LPARLRENECTVARAARQLSLASSGSHGDAPRCCAKLEAVRQPPHPPSPLTDASICANIYVIDLLEDTAMAKSKGTHKSHRDAGTGQFVTENYAKRHPKTTVTETIKNPSKKGK